MKAKIELQENGCLCVFGPLNFATVAKLYGKGAKLLRKEYNGVVNLTASIAEDSSGLALLIEWYRLTQRHHQRPLRFIGVPLPLMAMAKVSGLSKILSFQVESCDD